MELTFHHLDNCRILPNRYHLLDLLPKNGKVAEVGVLGGEFSKEILSRCTPEQLILIDTFFANDYAGQDRFTKRTHYSFIKDKFKEEIDLETVEVVRGLSWEILDLYPNHYFDWIYIDADHSYESVKKDLSKAHSKVKEEGVLVMNDYIFSDHHTLDKYGVIRAVNEFCVEHNWELIYFALHPEMFCDVALRKISAS